MAGPGRGKGKRYPPWHYPKDSIPSTYTLNDWRKRASKLAREKGAKGACGICKRPLEQWGRISLKHPRSYGKTRNRRICTACAQLLIHMLDVLEWFGACDHLPPEAWDNVRHPGDRPQPEEPSRSDVVPPWDGPPEEDPYADQRPED